MGNLADRIEVYLRRILEETNEGYIVLQRSVLADAFSCAPSQINYVLDTRFTVERGFLVETRRGGGGYVRIVRLILSPEGQFQQAMRKLIGEQLSQERAYGLLGRLLEEEILTIREAAIIKSILSRQCFSGVLEEDMIRARMMKSILTTLCREDLE